MSENYCYAYNMKLRWGHFRVLLVASCGQILGAIITTLIGVILPLIKISHTGGLSSFMQSAICVSELAGIVIGSVFVGRLTEKYGYLLFFRISPVIILISSLSLLFISHIGFLIFILFIIGICIGSEYAIDAAYVSEIMPDKWRFIMVGITKGSASLGYVLTALICYEILKTLNSPEYWNFLILLISGMSLIMILTRLKFVESPKWLIDNNKKDLAEKDLQYLLGKDVVIGPHWTKTTKKKEIKQDKQQEPFINLKNIPRIILSGIPWACEGVGVYGIGMFTPILLMALHIGPVNVSEYNSILFSIETTAFISLFIVAGFIFGISLQSKINNILLQTLGFFGSVIGLIILFIGFHFKLPIWVSLCGFMFFEFALNAGPHLITFVIPSMIYDIEERSIGEGVAAAIGKIGALTGVFFIPFLLKSGGGDSVLIFTIITFLAGGIITSIFGKIVFGKRKTNSNKESDN